MSIPVTPRRTEPLLLPRLRELFPDVTFDTIERNDLEPPFTEATLADSMQGMSTPISQYVRLRLGVRCMKEDHTGETGTRPPACGPASQGRSSGSEPSRRSSARHWNPDRYA